MNNRILLTVVCAAIAGSFSDGFCGDHRDTDFRDENERSGITNQKITNRTRTDEGVQLDQETQEKLKALHAIFMDPYKIQPRPVEPVAEAAATAKTTTPMTTAVTKKEKKNKGNDAVDRAAAPKAVTGEDRDVVVAPKTEKTAASDVRKKK